MRLVHYISRHPNQKVEKGSAYDEEGIVAKLILIFASVISLNLQFSQTASQFHLQTLLQTQDLAPQITPKSDPALQ